VFRFLAFITLSGVAAGCAPQHQWTIRAPETMAPAARDLIDGRQVREGRNLVARNLQGHELELIVRAGRVREWRFKYGEGQVDRIQRTDHTRLGQCEDNLNSCLGGCFSGPGSSSRCDFRCFAKHWICQRAASWRDAWVLEVYEEE
jgi:hypothetical protein